jgi:hypothetical protein
VPKFARDASGSAIKMLVNNQAPADASPDRKKDHVLCVLANTNPPLSVGSGVGIVLNNDISVVTLH